MASAIRYFDVEYGKIKSISGIEDAKAVPGVKQIFIVHGIGETMDGIKSSGDRAGFVISQADSVEKAIEACVTAKKRIRIEVE